LTGTVEMDVRIAYALHRALHGDVFSFGYSGAFHDEQSARLIALGEAAMEGSGAARSARQRLAYVMVEAYQNIIRHRTRLPQEVARGYGRSLFQLRCHPGGQQVVSVNPVLQADLPELCAALEDLSGLDAAQLKERFLSKLGNDGPRQRGGAGLGLIEMARRSGQELRYGIKGLGEEHALFLLQICFGDDPELDRAIPMTAVLSGTIVQQDILFFFRGPRMSAVDDALVQLMEKDLDERGELALERKRGFLAMSGVLDQLSAPGAVGMMLMARTLERYELVAGVPLDPERAASVGGMIDRVNAMDEQELRALYRDLLLGRGAEQDPLVLALVDLARTSPEPLEWHVSIGPEGSYGALRVVV
jgi:hypothetical protein